MRTRQQVRWDFVQQWLRKASSDLRAAKFLAEQQLDDYEAAAFHAQQCAERVIEAYSVRCQIEFPEPRDLGRVRRIIATHDADLAQQLADTDTLSLYAVELRYPGDLEAVSQETAKRALKVAEIVCDRIRQKLEEYLKGGRPA